MKKLLLMIILIAVAFFAGRFFNKIRSWLKTVNFRSSPAIIIGVAVMFLLIGLMLGKGLSPVKRAAKAVLKSAHVSIPAAKRDKITDICNFESDSDLRMWKTRNSAIERSKDFVTAGSYGAKISLFAGGDTDNVLIEDYFEDNTASGNWAGYGQVKIDLYNGGVATERLILKLKDSSGKAWQREFYLVPKQKTEAIIYLADLSGALNTSAIRQMNFFRWKPAGEAIIYMDNIRLIPPVESEITKPAIETGHVGPTAADKTGSKGEFVFDKNNPDIGIGVETPIEKVFLESAKFKGTASDIIDIELARNEYEAKQLVVHSKKELDKVTIEKSDLEADIDGKRVTLDKSNIRCYVVDYVKTKKPGYQVSFVGWWPDPLEEKESFHIAANSLRPVWIEVYAPEGIPAGEYTGELKLNLGKGGSRLVKLQVKVWDFSLPKNTALKTAFDFYDGRFQKMYRPKAGENNEEYAYRLGELKKKYYIDMINHRIMPVFNFDFSDGGASRDIKTYLKYGLSAFAIGKYNGSSGNNWPKDPTKLYDLVSEYREYARILKAAGLIDMSYIYSYDEPQYGDPHVNEVTQMVHTADPALKNMVCLHALADPASFPGWGNDIDIWCIRNATFNEAIADIYKKKGKEVWVYVSGPAVPYPTLVIDYPAMAYRIVPWMCWKYGLTGYLYWCVNFWDENPWQNTMNTKWEQNGNGLLYYPGESGPVGSIRLKITRDGIEDYEYLNLLRSYLAEARREKLPVEGQRLERFERLLTIDSSLVRSMADYTKDAETLLKRRREIAEAIEELVKVSKKRESDLVPVTVAETKPADFKKVLEASSGRSFGPDGALTFEIYRGGRFEFDEKIGARQISDSYRDSAYIRSTKPLPATYTVSAIVGEIDYSLDKIKDLRPDPEYEEGPMDENGCYLLAITDTEPSGHHPNDWWHKHRKVAIDVDNNVWGSGMPNPVFMVYFDAQNRLRAYNGKTNHWQTKWDKAVMYDPRKFYNVEIRKTETEYILSVYEDDGTLIKTCLVPLEEVWHGKDGSPDYFVIGDPHENYYQGSMKIKSIKISS